MTHQETWLAIQDYPGYEVSSRGRVRSLPREVPRGTGTMKKLKGRMLSQSLVGGSTGGGRYPGVVLFREGKRKTAMVHSLMLETFVGPRPEGMFGCHYDDVPTNNVIENLYWGTPSENTADAMRSGRHHAAKESAKKFCKWGHEYTPENTYRRRDGSRDCRACHRRQVNEANSRKRC